ncbi:MAG TPA: mechanosensitive ion channel family protein [Rhizomicrobium sp.]|nr:mechanosensitive ion channel family protein [Rhizomicrobium sp.]
MIWAFFVAILLLCVRLFGGPLIHDYAPGQTGNIEHIVTTALIISFALVLDRFVRRFYWEGHLKQRRNRETPKLIQDIVTVFLVVVALTVALWWQEGLSLAGIAAGSIAIAAGIGVALQPDLQDIVSGIAINMEGSYSIGDWITVSSDQLEKPIYGCISGSSWHSTYVTLEDGTRASVPNHLFTANVVLNHSHPIGAKRLWVEIGFDARLPSDRVIDMLMGEAFKVVRQPGLSRTPDPDVVVDQITQDAIIYHVRFWFFPNQTSPSRAKSLMLRALQEVVLQNELPLPVTQIEIAPPPNIEDILEPREIREAIANTLLFHHVLSDAEQEELAGHSKPVELTKGSILMHQGDAAVSMFIVLEGAISIAINTPAGEQQEVAVSAAGDVVGEMSLMTGAPRTATVTALTRLRALEITREAIDGLLKKNPTLFERFSRVLAQRQLEIDALANRRVDKRAVENDILTRMRAFFSRMTSRKADAEAQSQASRNTP